MQNSNKLTPKQEEFCKAIVYDGLSFCDAYRKAYGAEKYNPNALYVKASNLNAMDKIQLRIKQMRDKLDNPRIMSALQRRERLTEIANNSPDENAQMKAIDLLNKMDGEYVTKIDADVSIGKLEDLL